MSKMENRAALAGADPAPVVDLAISPESGISLTRLQANRLMRSCAIGFAMAVVIAPLLYGERAA